MILRSGQYGKSYGNMLRYSSACYGWSLRFHLILAGDLFIGLLSRPFLDSFGLCYGFNYFLYFIWLLPSLKKHRDIQEVTPLKGAHQSRISMYQRRTHCCITPFYISRCKRFFEIQIYCLELAGYYLQDGDTETCSKYAYLKAVIGVC